MSRGDKTDPETTSFTGVKTDCPDILKEIIIAKNMEVTRLKREVPIEDVVTKIGRQESPLNFGAALTGKGVKIIAECKRASPSRGTLRKNLDAEWLAHEYVENGASAVSVLTNSDHFQGSLDDLETVAAVAHRYKVPVLRKEFIFDSYQVHEARASGADAVLLIVAMLDLDQLRSLKNVAERYGMQCLVEVHDELEMDKAIEAGARIVGINNRDLRTFRTTLDVTDKLAHRAPSGCILVSESGIKTRDDVERVRRAGATAALIGDALVSAPSPGARLRELT